MKFFIVTIILLFSVLNNSTLIAATVLGTGSGALLGNDLTDPEDNGVDSGTNGSNFNWTSINASSKKTFAGEGSYSVFDNNVSSGSAKWCCDNPTQWIYVQLSQSYVLSHFTITSGNDAAGRDPDIWKIQGSNNGSNWTDIYSYSSNGNSPFSARHQVIKYTGAGDDFATPDSYSYFRYYVTSTVSGGHQINELEFFGDADSTAPTLSSSTPADNATGVAVDSNIVLNFSESVDAESGNITLKKTSDNSTVETISVTGELVSGSGSSQITVNPSSTLDSSTEYYVLIDASAFDDSSSNSYAGISSTTALSFTTADVQNPTLSSSTPADNATGVAVDSNIVLNFSESVDAESGNITLKKTSDNSTVETISVTGELVSGSGSSQITVNPSSTLDSSTEYYVLIDASAFDDSSSNSYAGISSTTALSFTTADVQNPTLSSSTPADNATGVAVDSNIVLNFSESVDAESGNITLKKTSDNSTVETISVTGELVSGSGSSQITVNPSSTLDSSTEYYVLIDASAFDDSSSNSYAGISSTTALSFTTADVQNPTLSSSTPADNATGVAVDSNIVLNFSESVDAESGNITLKKTSDNSTVETISVTGELVSGSGSSQITVNPSSTLDSSTEYYVLIDASAFDDSSSNSYAGISSTTALSFTTADVQNPTLSSSTPADNATVLLTANIVLNFSESVDAESGNITLKKTSDNSTVETISVTGELVSGSGSSQITVNPSSTLDSSTEYYVLIDASAFDDSSSNSYAGISSTTALSFTTADVQNPTLSSSTPADNATAVALDANIVLNFSEAVDAESGNITIKKTYDDSTIETIDVTGAKVSGSGGTEITINPGNDLSEQTEYYVLIDATAFDDNAGNSYAGISSTTALSFTTENSTTDPLTDKDVVGSIDAQTEAPKRILQYVTTPVINRMDWLRHHRKETNLTNQNIKFQFSNAMLASLSNVIPASIDINENLDLSDNWSYWSEGSIGVGKIGDTSSSSSKDIDSNGITIGMDKKIDENKMYGYALRFGRDEVEVGTSGTSLDTNSYSLSIYGTFPHEDAKFLDTILGVSSLKTDHIRKNGSNTLTGERSGRQVFGSINFSTKYNKEKFNITPNARIDLGYTELSNYSEIGTDALTYDKQKIETGMVSIGLRLDDIIQFKSITFKPSGLLEYGANFSPSSDATVSYVSDPNTDYTLSIAHEATHNIRAGLGFELIKENGLTIIANYERDQSNNAHSDTLYLGASYITNRDTEYAMKIDGSEDLKAGFDITKKINGFDLKFNANQSLSENSDQTANVSLSRSF